MSKKWKKFVKENKDIEGLAARVFCINKDGCLLIIKRSKKSYSGKGKWDIPGGHVDEADESLELAALRELFEETNLVCSEKKLIYVGRDDWNGDKVYYYTYLYTHGDIKLLPNPESGFLEHTKYEWATIDDIIHYENQELTTFPIYLLRKALEKVQNL